MQSFNIYRYSLATFTESRSTDYASKPYEGEVLDFYAQPAPRPWEIPVTTPKLFENHEANIKVPFTSSKKPCHVCSERGCIQCADCEGLGKKECTSCIGFGRNAENAPCTSCNQTGQVNCSVCHAKGIKVCGTCNGNKQLLTYINLKVEWKTNIDRFTGENKSGLAVEHLDKVNGKVIFENDQFMLYPLMGFPDVTISQASEYLLKEHQAKYSQNSRILQQYHRIAVVPITRVTYTWKAGTHHFFVFGMENQVKDFDYPETCCCCSIM
ncbi:hypothetical protein UPYG_G00163760 [Umbra pygmaea]|uniref:Protein SSUH2 homolog n=1 Tax=Umbra pygmaea TaxID=75934 RepID=A0ABD0WM48_UMBPY